MSHLSLETLARIVDEPATSAEAAHLEACAACRDELDALREDVHALGMLPELEPARDAWPALEQRLAAEGLLRPRQRPVAFPRLMQLAAALVLFLAGSLAGRMSAQTQPVTVADRTVDGPAAGVASTQDPATRDVADRGLDDRLVDLGTRSGSGDSEAGDSDVRARDVDPAAAPGSRAPRAAEQTERPGRSGAVRLASDAVGGVGAGSMADAATLLRQTEELYLAALTQYAEMATQAESGDPVARLAALQSIVMTTQAALQEAPTDPVINGYHLTALAQRDATLAQVTAETSQRWY